MKDPAGPEYYDKKPRYYSFLSYRVIEDVLQMLGLSGVKEFGPVLDIGCGNGVFTGYMRGLSNLVVGVDFSKNRLAEAMKRMPGPKAMFVCADAIKFMTTTPLRFDLIAMFEVLEHVEDPFDMLRAADRVLVPNGVVIGSVPIKLKSKAHVRMFNDLNDVKGRLAVTDAVLWRQGNHSHAMLKWTKGALAEVG